MNRIEVTYDQASQYVEAINNHLELYSSLAIASVDELIGTLAAIDIDLIVDGREND